MNKKLLMLLAAGALVITGCAGKEASKTSDQKNTPEQKESKTENKETTSKEKSEVKHDLAAAEKLANLVAISGNDLSRLNEQTNLLAWITQDRSTKFNSPEGVPLAKVSVQDFVDVVNEFSDKTYSKEEALEYYKVQLSVRLMASFQQQLYSLKTARYTTTKKTVHLYLCL